MLCSGVNSDLFLSELQYIPKKCRSYITYAHVKSDSAIFFGSCWSFVGAHVKIKTIVAFAALHQVVSIVLPNLFHKNICSLKSAKNMKIQPRLRKQYSCGEKRRFI